MRQNNTFSLKKRRNRIVMYLLMAIIAVVVSFSVAGAWFIDRDTVDSTMDMGGAVIVKLVGTGEDGTIQNFKQLYDSDGGAYPGDKILDSIKVQMGEKTEESVLRVQYSVDILDKEKNVKTQDLTEAETKLATLLKNDLRAKTTLFSSDWSQTTSDWIYYKHLASGKTKPIDLFDEYSLPLPDSEMDNQYQELSFRISLVAEAIQAANIMSHNEWNDDITNLSDSALMERVIKYNGERFAEVDEVLPYIETTGGQYIDTGYVANLNTAVETTFQTSTGNKWLFGSRTTGGASNTYAVYVSSMNTIWFQMANDSSSTQFSVGNIKDKQTTITVNKDAAYLNGTQIGTVGRTSFGDNTLSLYLGVINANGSGTDGPFVGKIYSSRIWDGGELVRFFVPARDKDGNVGFYDLVTHQMCLNAGTGNFAYGHSINYIANGGTIAANAPKTFVSGDLPITLPVPTRAGYEFGGWFLSSDFSGVAQTTIPAGTDSNVYVYAKWIKTYNITYHLGGGINAEDNPTEFNERTLPLTLKAPTRDGFTFGGWYQNPACSGNQVTTIEVGTEKNVSLWAKWNAIEYSVSYVLNGGTNSDQNVAKYSILDTPVKLYNPTRDGYLFEGWFASSDFSGERMTYLSKDNLGDVTLHAKWSLAYTITYNTNGGFNDGRNPSVFTENTETFTLFEAEKVNYSFLGWFDNEELTGTPITQIAKGTKNNIVLWAKWSSTQITVTFNPNGGGVSPLTKVVKKGGTYGELPTPTKAGYTFNGWVGKNLFDKTATAYKKGPYLRGSGEEVSYGAYSIYQIQVPAGATLTITNSGKSIAPGYAFYTALGTYITGADYERKAVITTTVPANATYIRVSVNFGEEDRKDIDYFQVEIGSTQTAYENYKIITPSTNITSTHNHALCAIWTENVYTVTYNLDGGTNAAGNPETFKRSNLPVLLYDATKNGEYFAGWYLDAEFTKRVTKIDAGSLKNIELWARFSQSPLVFDLVGSSAYSVRAANTSISGNIEIPQTYNGKPVVVIQNSAFKDCSNVTSVLIPSSIKSIGINAFENCSNITETTIPEGVTLIGNNTFKGCVKLASVTLPTSIESFGANALAGCTSLTSIVLPKNIQEIGANAFANCSKLATIEVFGDTPATLKIGVFPSNVSKIYVKPSLVSTYKTSWAEYKDKIVGFTQCTITYNLNGGTNNNKNITSFLKIDLPVKLYAPTKENADFLGWYTTSDFSGEKVTEITTTENITLYARWDRKMTITYVLNGGVNLSNLTTITDSMLPYTLSDATKSGYNFIGWFTDAELTRSIYVINTYGDITLYADWEEINPDLVFTLNSDGNSYSVKARSTDISGEVKIPATYKRLPVTTLPGDTAFRGCSKLTALFIPKSVTTIKVDNQYWNLFRDCSTSLVLYCEPESQPSGWSAYWNYCGSSYLRVVWGAADIGHQNSEWQYVEKSDGTVKVLKYIGSSADVLMPNEIESKNISEIEKGCFEANTSIISIVVSENVVIIGNRAFSNCSSMRRIFLPVSVKSISASDYYNSPFNGCAGTLVIYSGILTEPSDWDWHWKQYSSSSSVLTTVWGVPGIGQNDSNWEYVEKNDKTILLVRYMGESIVVTIPSNISGKMINEVYESCFVAKSDITSIDIPNSLTKFGANAFATYNSLTKVNISNLSSWFNITFVNENSNPLYRANHLFINGTELTNLAIPSSINMIKNYALYGASGIKSITIPSSVTTIGCYAFGSCRGITSITIPDSVTNIENSAFDGCTALVSVILSNNLSALNSGVFSGCSGLKSITIPSSVKIIKGSAFYGCKSLTSISIPNSVTSIKGWAFTNCTSLTSIYIPSSVTEIDGSSKTGSPFFGCYSTTKIYCGHTSKPDGWGAYWNYFSNSNSLSVVWGVSGLPES